MVDLNWDRDFALEQAGDEEEMLNELLGLFRESSLADCMKIKAGIQANDATAVAEAAHSIKGAAASLGFESIRHVSHQIENAGKAGDIAAATSCLPDLEDLLQQAKEL